MIDDVWANRMAMKRKLEKDFVVLEGNDFEDSMLAEIFENKERRMLDNYTKVKAPKNLTNSMRKYNETIKKSFSQDQINMLLHFCRMCSYAGGNGLPDFIAIGEKPRFIFSSALPEQALFSEMCKSLGIEIQIETDKSFRDVISKSLDKSDLSGMELSLEEANKTSNINHVKEAERAIARNPLFVLRKMTDSIDLDLIKENMLVVEEINNNEKQEMLGYEALLSKDEELAKFGRKKDNETLDKKSDYVAGKFNVSKYKAMEILEFMGQI